MKASSFVAGSIPCMQEPGNELRTVSADDTEPGRQVAHAGR